MKIEVTDLLHVNVEVTDIDRAIVFYDLFGLPRLQRKETPGRQGAWYGFPDGRELHISVGGSKPLNRSHFAVCVADVTIARAVLEEAGAPVETERELPGIARIFTRDPDGNRIELQQFLP